MIFNFFFSFQPSRLKTNPLLYKGRTENDDPVKENAKRRVFQKTSRVSRIGLTSWYRPEFLGYESRVGTDPCDISLRVGIDPTAADSLYNTWNIMI